MSPLRNEARLHIDEALEAAGRVIQDQGEINLAAGPGVAVRKFKVSSGHGFAAYLLFALRSALGQIDDVLSDLDLRVTLRTTS